MKRRLHFYILVAGSTVPAIFNGGDGGAFFDKAELIQQACRCRFRPEGTSTAGELLQHDRPIDERMSKISVLEAFRLSPFSFIQLLVWSRQLYREVFRECGSSSGRSCIFALKKTRASGQNVGKVFNPVVKLVLENQPPFQNTCYLAMSVWQSCSLSCQKITVRQVGL